MADQYDLNAPVTAAANQRTANQGFLGGLQNQTNDFLGRYKGLLGSQESTTAAASRLGNQFNLPQLQQNANQAQQTLYDLPSTYGAATRGYDVNANQLSRIIGQKTSELAPVAQRAQDQANFAQGQVSTLLGYNQADQNRALLPYQMEGQLLPGQQSIAANLWSSANENELSALNQKNSLGVQLSEGEKNRQQQLEVAKMNNQAQMDQMQKSYDLNKGSNSAQNRYITLADGATLYDTHTGQIVSSNQKDFKASGGGGGNDPLGLGF